MSSICKLTCNLIVNRCLAGNFRFDCLLFFVLLDVEGDISSIFVNLLVRLHDHHKLTFLVRIFDLRVRNLT